MAPAPIIFAMANPEPEIRPELAKAARPDAIIATGRSDYPNQVNNVLGFPFIFRGALDVRATGINDEMKIAAAQRDRRTGARARARGGRDRLWRAAQLRSRLHHPRAVRSAADGGGARRGRQGGDGFGRRDPADPRSRGISPVAARAAQPDHLGAQSRLRGRARAPEARDLRRGRGGSGAARRDRVQGRRLRHAGAGRARRRARSAARARRDQPGGVRAPQQPHLAAGAADGRVALRAAPAARLSAPRCASG